MRSFATFLVVLASCGALVLAAPTPQVLNDDAANERANDGAKVRWRRGGPSEQRR